MSGNAADAPTGRITVLFATSNRHKLEEVTAILDAVDVEVVGLPADLAVPTPDEQGKTFEENARIKAVGYARACRRLCLADDSGLEVDALGGRPGVRSARYAGRGRTRAERDTANNEKLLNELTGVHADRRHARFVCAMCLADADGTVLAETRGTFEGVIAPRPRGEHGFGYDPLLLLPEGRTTAELTPEEKNARSHRAAAARRMAALMPRAMKRRSGEATSGSSP